MAASTAKVVAAVTFFKLLLLPSYRSTDFEVHRNWLAVTHSLPLEKWYFEKTSEWTLDYPPLFAWFEYLLSYVAKYFDANMLIVSNLNYSSQATILFQRLSVIVTDSVYILAVNEFCNNCLPTFKRSGTDHCSVSVFTEPRLVASALMLGNFGLLLVDHIHFQYNGFLSGLWMLSVVRIYQNRNMEAALLFATLLNFKHIYLYAAPAYFVYLLRAYCFKEKQGKNLGFDLRNFSFFRLCKLGTLVVMVFGVSFGPFISLGQLPQVLSRLFPFKRGLCHSYWAPNFWALYNGLDKVLSVVGPRIGIQVNTSVQASMTGGLVQEYKHTVLPSIKPIDTLALTVLAILPALVHLWRYPTGPKAFLRCVVLCVFGSFLFGWHVHEKAVLLIILPLGFLVFDSANESKIFLMISTSGHLALFPLIFTQAETPIKVTMMLSYTLFTFVSLGNIHGERFKGIKLPLLNKTESLYVWCMLPLQVYCCVIHTAVGLGARLPFVPLMMQSIFCALGVVYAWIKFYHWTMYGAHELYSHNKLQ